MQRLDVVDAAGQVVAPSTAAAFRIAVENGPNRSVVTNPEGLALSVTLSDGSTWTTHAVFDIRDF